MSYFASLARHSGLQFSGQHPSTRGGPAARLDALDVEETVIVPPAGAEGPVRVEASEPRRVVDDDSASTPAERRSAADPAPIRIPIPRTEAGSVPIRDRHVPIAAPDTRPVVVPATTQEGTDALIPVAGAPPEMHRAFLRADPEPRVPTSEHGAEVVLRNEKTPTNHFTRTAELLAAPALDPVETQTLILREVQEWIARGPRNEAAPLELSAPPSPEIVVAGDDTPQSTLEPGVRRIRRSHRAAPVVEPGEGETRIEEQRLDLSIGTISVVIEGEDRSRPSSHAPPDRQIERPSPPPRRTPRLGRHYL
jgi:hypothetical protein